MKADYSGAKESRFRRDRLGVTRIGRSADWHYRLIGDQLKLMELARDMDRNDLVVGQGIDRACNNIVQDGFKLDPKSGDKDFDKEVRERWHDWSHDPNACDLAGEMTFPEIEYKACRQPMVDGDMFFLPHSSGHLEGVEAHRCRTPQGTYPGVINGVLLNSYRRRQQYWFTKDDVDPLKPVSLIGDVEKYDARDESGFRQVFHVYNPKRVSQTRGISALAPIFDALGQFEDIQFAKLIQHQIVSCFAVIRERTNNWAGGDVPAAGEKTEESLPDGTVRQLEGIGPGMEIRAKIGEKITGFSPGVPNPEYMPQMRLILSLIGVNLGMPLVMLLMDASETNFSGWRGAFDQAKMGFRANQRQLIYKLHQPTYVWKMRQWMYEDPGFASRAERLGPKAFRHHWNRPSWPYINPREDAAADLVRVKNGLTSYTRIHHENGDEWGDLSTEIVADNGMLIRKAKAEAMAINKEFDDGDPVTWRDVASISLPAGMTLAINPDGDQPQPTKKKKAA